MNDQIKQAIGRSISHNEIVSVTIAGNVDDAIAAIESLIDYDTTETDHVLIDGNKLDALAARDHVRIIQLNQKATKGTNDERAKPRNISSSRVRKS